MTNITERWRTTILNWSVSQSTYQPLTIWSSSKCINFGTTKVRCWLWSLITLPTQASQVVSVSTQMMTNQWPRTRPISLIQIHLQISSAVDRFLSTSPSPWGSCHFFLLQHQSQRQDDLCARELFRWFPLSSHNSPDQWSVSNPPFGCTDQPMLMFPVSSAMVIHFFLLPCTLWIPRLMRSPIHQVNNLWHVPKKLSISVIATLHPRSYS